MDEESTRGVLAVLHGVDDDEVMEAMVEERQSRGEACWTCAYNENSGTMRE